MAVVMLHSSAPTMSQGQVSSSFSTRSWVNWITRPAIFSYSSPESPKMPPSQASRLQNSGMFHSLKNSCMYRSLEADMFII